jgi:hypothetical protein
MKKPEPNKIDTASISAALKRKSDRGHGVDPF